MESCAKLDRFLPLRLRQTLSIIFGSLEMIFFGGIIYGFNALTPVLQKEGIYSHLCVQNDPEAIGCLTQTKMYGYAFVTYVVAQMIMLFIVGFLVDRFGFRLVKLGASILFSIGAVLFAVTDSENSWLIFPAGVFICVGGMTGLVCNFAFSQLFTKSSAFVLSFIGGSYDAASSVFAVVTIAYNYGFSYKSIFYLFAGVGLAMNTFSSLFIATCRLSDMSTLLSPRSLRESKSKNLELVDDERTSTNAQTKNSLGQSQISEVLNDFFPTVASSLCSFPFFVITCFFSFAMTRFTFFLTQFGDLTIAGFPDQPELRQHLAKVLSFALAGGIFAGMACGFTIDFIRSRMQPTLSNCLAIGAKKTFFWLRLCPHAVAMFIVTTAATFLSSFVFFPYTWAYHVNFFILVVMRGFLFNSISSFIMTAFPIEQFGTLYGVSGSIAGAFSCIQYAMLLLPVAWANLVNCFFVPIMGAVPVIIVMKGINPCKKTENFA